MVKKEIGQDAGVVWQLLFDKGRLSLRELGEFSHLSDKRILLAVGWLARENKVVLTEDENLFYVELIQIDSQFYL